MLAYAFQILKPERYENIDKTSFDNIHNMFASILAGGIGKQLKQGLYREYVEHRETVLTVRGKIDMPETVKNRIFKRILPALGSEILSTGKTAVSMGFKVGVMAEILGSVQNGIGRQINYCRLDLNTAGIIGWTVVLIVLSALINTLFGKINSKVKEEQGWKD